MSNDIIVEGVQRCGALGKCNGQHMPLGNVGQPAAHASASKGNATYDCMTHLDD